MHDLIDIGVNLTHKSFAVDRPEVIERAAAVGVKRLLVTGSDLPSSRDAQRLAAQYPHRLYATAGIHPHHALGFDGNSTAELRELARSETVVAIGECGLDYFRDFSPRPVQREAFATQLALGAEIGKPVFLHQRDAHEDFHAIVKEHSGNLKGGVAHCFTGARAEMENYLALGLHVGITGWICDERRAENLRAAVPHLPLDRVLLETDAPYLLPRDLRPVPRTRRNEPAFLTHVLRITAQFMGTTEEALAAAATRNSELLFGLRPTPA